MDATTVYFVAFTDGVVKVGRTANFKQRLWVLRSDAKKRGAVDTQTWTMAHPDARRAEWFLLSAARAEFERPWGAEYFTAEFGEFVAGMARRLDMWADGLPIVNSMRDELKALLSTA